VVDICVKWVKCGCYIAKFKMKGVWYEQEDRSRAAGRKFYVGEINVR
jgi:hypothetical protein